MMQHVTSRSRKNLLLLAVFIILLIGIFQNTFFCFAETQGTANLTADIEYRFGDSPSSNGQYAWLDNSFEEDSWKHYDPAKPPFAGKYTDMWLRLKLPENSYDEPSLSFTMYARYFEIYLDGTLIFKSTDAQELNLIKPEYVVSLPHDSDGKTLSFVIDYAYPDTLGYINNVTLGSKPDIEALASNAVFGFTPFITQQSVLGSLFLFAGVILILAFIMMRDHPLNFLNLGFSSVCMGLWVLAFNIPEWHAKLIVASIGSQLLPVGFLAFTERMFACRAKIYYKILRLAIWLSFVICLFLDLANVAIWTETIKYYHYLLVTSIVIILYSVLRATIKRNKNAPGYLIGFSLLAIAGIIDMLGMFYIYIPWKQSMIAPWAMLLLILILVYIVVKDMNGKMVAYAKEIEEKNENLSKARDEISQWNKTLELKVAHRTQELEDANFELSCAMDNLRSAQTQLIQSEKMAAMGTLVAGLLHEINTPLGTIKSSLQMEKMLLDTVQFESADPMQNLLLVNKTGSLAAERIIDILKGLKNFSRIDEAEIKEVDLRECLDGTVMLLEGRLTDKIRVDKRYQELPPVACYPRLLNQVFLNIIENAIDAVNTAGGSGLIIISTALRNDQAVISFEDNGKGIPEENIQKIFDPGYTTKGVGIGTGLGLAIAFNIVKKHNGSIVVESEEGMGTTVTVKIPVTIKGNT